MCKKTHNNFDFRRRLFLCGYCWSFHTWPQCWTWYISECPPCSNGLSGSQIAPPCSTWEMLHFIFEQKDTTAGTWHATFILKNVTWEERREWVCHSAPQKCSKGTPGTPSAHWTRDTFEGDFSENSKSFGVTCTYCRAQPLHTRRSQFSKNSSRDRRRRFASHNTQSQGWPAC